MTKEYQTECVNTHHEDELNDPDDLSATHTLRSAPAIPAGHDNEQRVDHAARPALPCAPTHQINVWGSSSTAEWVVCTTAASWVWRKHHTE